MKRIIVDVREPFEYQEDHVEGALNIPPAELLAGAKKLDGIPKDTELILYCRTGSRSSVSIQILKTLGFTDLINGVNAGQVKKRYT